MEDCKVACSTPAFRLQLINLSKLARCSHRGLFRVLRLRSHSNCLRAFSSLKRSIGNECYQNSALLPLTGNGIAGFFTYSSWHLLREAEGVEGWRGGALSFSLFSIHPPLCITVPLKRAACLWSVYPRLCQSKLVSRRLHSSALQYLCLLPCLRFLMTEPLWVKLERMQMGCDVLWTAPALCVTITSHILSSLNIASTLWCIRLWITGRDVNSHRMSWMSLNWL